MYFRLSVAVDQLNFRVLESVGEEGKLRVRWIILREDSAVFLVESLYQQDRPFMTRIGNTISIGQQVI